LLRDLDVPEKTKEEKEAKKIDIISRSCVFSELVQPKLNIGDSDGDSTPPEFEK